jgi:hypothetical protein
MVQHRVAGESDLSGDAQPLRFRLDTALELNAVIALERFDSVETLQKIEMPHRATELAVSGASKAHFSLFRDCAFDGRVFDCLEIGLRDFASLALCSRFPEFARAQQTADMYRLGTGERYGS